MRRNLLVVALGISFLILITWAGTIITTIVPQRVTAQVQTTHVGPLQITLQVDPNPPRSTQPATLVVRVLQSSSQLPVMNAHVTLASTMETMDMGTERVAASALGGGTYQASVQFDMSGPWQVVINVAVPGAAPVSVSFQVAAH